MSICLVVGTGFWLSLVACKKPFLLLLGAWSNPLRPTPWKTLMDPGRGTSSSIGPDVFRVRGSVRVDGAPFPSPTSPVSLVLSFGLTGTRHCSNKGFLAMNHCCICCTFRRILGHAATNHHSSTGQVDLILLKFWHTATLLQELFKELSKIQCFYYVFTGSDWRDSSTHTPTL